MPVASAPNAPRGVGKFGKPVREIVEKTRRCYGILTRTRVAALLWYGEIEEAEAGMLLNLIERVHASFTETGE